MLTAFFLLAFVAALLNRHLLISGIMGNHWQECVSAICAHVRVHVCPCCRAQEVRNSRGCSEFVLNQIVKRQHSRTERVKTLHSDGIYFGFVFAERFRMFSLTNERCFICGQYVRLRKLDRLTQLPLKYSVKWCLCHRNKSALTPRCQTHYLMWLGRSDRLL